MTRAAHRRKRSAGWLSSPKRSPKHQRMPLWQWFIAVPAIAVMIAGIGLFVYLAMINPRAASGLRTQTVVVLERVEKHDESGRLDTSASFLTVSVEGTRMKIAPQLPDWNRVAQGDLIDVDVMGKGPTLAISAWRARVNPAAPPDAAPAPSSGTGPAAPSGS